jgi:hypothetical protein
MFGKTTVTLGLFLVTASNFAYAQSIKLIHGPAEVVSGESFSVTVESDFVHNGIVQVQLVHPPWKRVTEKWKEIESGKQTTELELSIPTDAVIGENYFWQVLLYDRDWKKKKEEIVNRLEGYDTKLSKTPATATRTPVAQSTADVFLLANWTPEGEWSIEWQDEFEGSGLPEKWYPFLGHTPADFTDKTEKGLRWTGKTEDTSWMYTSKTGNHWLNGEGQLVMRIVSDKTKTNANGLKTSGAYLMTGYPEKWDDTEPTNVKWKGKFVSPADIFPPGSRPIRLKDTRLGLRFGCFRKLVLTTETRSTVLKLTLSRSPKEERTTSIRASMSPTIGRRRVRGRNLYSSTVVRIQQPRALSMSTMISITSTVSSGLRSQ